MNFHSLTNEELVSALSLRNDLTDMEQELLDRLIRALDAMNAMEKNSGDNA